MHVRTNGIVLRETSYKETDKMLTVLARGDGKISVSAKGARKRGSPFTAATQLLAYSDMTLFESHGRYQLDEVETIDLFFGLRQDLDAFSLAIYLAELTDNVCAEGEERDGALQLLLYTLQLLCRGTKRPVAIVKAVFELRLMWLEGFVPEPEGFHELTQLSAGAFEAMRHVTACDLEKIFAFGLNENDTAIFADACEKLAQAQIDRSLASLEEFHKL
ncbi:hypothetical protein FACS1894202_05210 [Clostridia bacterium]|nr:hypothetical protein FACS1894202_05210 [Clostridia bacterium]